MLWSLWSEQTALISLGMQALAAAAAAAAAAIVVGVAVAHGRSWQPVGVNLMVRPNSFLSTR